jgi:hypothetical protein
MSHHRRQTSDQADYVDRLVFLMTLAIWAMLLQHWLLLFEQLWL